VELPHKVLDAPNTIMGNATQLQACSLKVARQQHTNQAKNKIATGTLAK